MTMRLRSFLLSVVVASCFVVCLPLSSAYAVLDDYDIQDGEIVVAYTTAYIPNQGVANYIKDTPWTNITVTNLTFTTEFMYSRVPTLNHRDTMHIMNNVNEALFAENETAILTFDGLVNNITQGSTEILFNPAGIYKTQVYAYSSNLQYIEILEDAEVIVRQNRDGTYSLQFNSGVLPFPVGRFEIEFYYDLVTAYPGFSATNYMSGSVVYKRTTGWKNHVFNYSYFPASSSISSQIKETVTEVKEEIVELPNKISDSIQDMLYTVIMPREEELNFQQDRFNQLLADRFGALYQVGDLVTDYANAFVESEQNTIDIPTVVIPLGEVDFEFGGWTVKVIPDGFEVVVEALKLIVSIACTFLFVNGLKRRFEGLVGGAPNA